MTQPNNNQTPQRIYRTRKIPTSNIAWIKELRGVSRFLLHLRELDAPESAVWKAKMLKYYTHRFNQMCASPPSPEATQWIDLYIAGGCVMTLMLSHLLVDIEYTLV